MRGKIVEYFTKANIVIAIIFGLLGIATANIPRTSFYAFIGAFAFWFIFYLLICKNHTAQIEKEINEYIYKIYSISSSEEITINNLTHF